MPDIITSLSSATDFLAVSWMMSLALFSSALALAQSRQSTIYTYRRFVVAHSRTSIIACQKGQQF